MRKMAMNADHPELKQVLSDRLDDEWNKHIRYPAEEALTTNPK